MVIHRVQVYPSKTPLPKERSSLRGRLRKSPSAAPPPDAEVAEMVINRLIDNAGVALAAINRAPVANARSQALAHPRPGGATLFGVPADAALRSRMGRLGQRRRRARVGHARHLPGGGLLASGRTISRRCSPSPSNAAAPARNCFAPSPSPTKSRLTSSARICLHEYKKDHIAHLGPSVAAGLGALLRLDTETIYQAVQQAVHVSFTTRQSRKGEISSWKAYAPAHAGKLAIEAVDRAMRGEKSPSPIYEGEDSVIAWMLGGPGAAYDVPLPAPGEPCRAILDSYTKEHSAEYQAQAWIDLAFRLRGRIPDLKTIRRNRHPHQPSHPRRHRHRLRRPAEVGPAGQPRDARPQPHVHLRRRAAHRLLASREKLRAGTRARSRPSSRCGKRSAPRKTRNGRAAITRPTRARRLSAGGW